MSLLDLVDQFQKKHKMLSNPVDPDSRANEFLQQLQASGQDLAKWDEDAWILAFRKLGLDDDEIAGALENLAGWGVVDNYVYE